jgi:hypothetical protein
MASLEDMYNSGGGRGFGLGRHYDRKPFLILIGGIL